MAEETTFINQIVLPSIAIAISVVAFLISCFSFRDQRRYNKKSLRPVGTIEFFKYEKLFNIKIVNKGCGPMQIKKFIAVLDGQERKNIVEHLPKKLFSGINVQFHTEPKGYWLAPGDELTLLKVEMKNTDAETINNRTKIQDILCEINTFLVCSDIYDTVQPAYQKSLEWFKKI